jgi:hypothetical protein
MPLKTATPIDLRYAAGGEGSASSGAPKKTSGR